MAAPSPFDRVICAAAVQSVPCAWVAQTKPGGRVLTPWGNAFHIGVLADLRVGTDGAARGHFEGDVAFMWVRDQRAPRRVVQTHVRPEEQSLTTSNTKLHPYEPINDFDASFAIGLRMPTVLNRVEFDSGDTQRFTIHLVDPGTDSWSSWHVDPEQRSPGHEVHRHGPRALFTELADAYEWWQEAGRPAHTRFGLTVSTKQQEAWLNDPRNPA